MAHIVGRIEEKTLLNNLYNSGKAEFVALYGRRRVGKTFLVREYFKNEFAFYHTGLSPFEMEEKQLLEQQLRSFSYSLSRYGADIYETPKDWMEAFNVLITLLENKLHSNPQKRMVVFIDEMPWMDTPRSGFVTALDHFWNGWGAGQENMMLIICGSSTSWINDNIINSTGGLYGRLTRSIHLAPMTLSEIEELQKRMGVIFDRYDIIQSYMIFGGIPYYHNGLQKGLSLAQNIDNLLFKDKAIFKNEFDRLFSSLFINPDEYKNIVRFLANRREGYTREEIKTVASSTGGGLSKVLKRLIECDFITQCRDFSGKEKNAKYKLTDPFCLFYLNFLEKKKTTNQHFWTSNLNKPILNSWSGFAFENICFLHISQIKKALGILGVQTEVSSWHSADNQIDMVISRDDRILNLCEIKFCISSYTITKEYDKKLKERLQDFITLEHPKRAVHQTFITTYGLTSNEYSQRIQSVVTLEDLFK